MSLSPTSASLDARPPQGFPPIWTKFAAPGDVPTSKLTAFSKRRSGQLTDTVSRNVQSSDS
eukprot:scaffold55523_cov32-Tisochrysis_lutea.AAC.2